MKTDLFAKMLVAVAFIASSGSAQTVDHDTTYSAADCKFFGNQASDNKLTYQSCCAFEELERGGCYRDVSDS